MAPFLNNKVRFKGLSLLRVSLFLLALSLSSPQGGWAALVWEPTSHDKSFQTFLRQTLHAKAEIGAANTELQELFAQTSFPKVFDGFALILYSKNAKRIVIVRRQPTELESIRQVINRAMLHPRIDEMQISNPSISRIQMDFILEAPQTINTKELNLQEGRLERFEIGVDGLRMTKGKKTSYFFPGDAFVRSILGVGQLQRYLARIYPEGVLDKVKLQRFRSLSYVSYQDDWVQLFRGIPVIDVVDRNAIETAANAGMEYLLRTQALDGRFMYYYDAAKDSFRNHEHPKRDLLKNPYYNILRHGGGALTYLFHYELYHEERVLVPTRKAIDYLVKQIKVYDTEEGKQAGYVFYNTKAKLGGSGIALYLLSEYQRLAGDEQYERWAKLLKEHLLNEIQEGGEFYYYHIYPGRAKKDERSFSFYYPGEALIGLVTYAKYVETDAEEKQRMIQKMEKALRFLLVDRKVKYKSHYQVLPSDSWLMMAIYEAWDIPEMQDDAYKEFVFADADQMVALMYTTDSALFPDYVGSFYYEYGDHPYPDGARAEGLMGAYELAVKVNDPARIKRYGQALKAAAWATLHLVNTPQSVYAVPNPEMTVGGIRFKLTRQWFRVDTIQHVASFYLKFLPYWEQSGTPS